jgi:cysteine sulfinate desulfinase/cysteine desulfurase-like protein
MGFDAAIAKGALRMSFGLGNSNTDVETALKALHEIVAARPARVAAVGW